MTVVDDDTIEAAAVAYLAGQPDVLAVLGAFPGTGKPYLFQQDLWTTMENTQSTACVLSYAGGWINPNLHNTMRFPRLRVEIYADPKRDMGNNPVNPAEVQRRLFNTYKTIDRYLHRPQNSGTQMWGDLRIISCLRMLEPNTEPVRDGTGLLLLNVTYAITEG